MEWEYKVITLQSGGIGGGKVDVSQLENLMNSLGRDEWELTAAFEASEAHRRTRDIVVLFKRSRN